MAAALLSCPLLLAPARPALAAGPVYIVADAMVDVDAGALVREPVLKVEDGRIAAVATHATQPPPAGATVIDLAGFVLLPGLIDMHTHLTLEADRQGYERLGISVPRATLYGAKNARLTLLAGFTTARDVDAPGYSDVALRDAIEAGDIVGPRLFVSGPALGITGGHCDDNLLPAEFGHKKEGVADGPWGVRARVRETLKYGADLIKFCATGGVLSKGTQVGARQYTPEEMAALVDEAHLAGRRVAAHAHGAEGIREAILAGADTVEHASFIDDEGIRLARERGTWLSMDIYNTEYILAEGEKAGFLPESIEKERRTGTTQRESFSRAHRAGVRMVFGTDAGVYPHGRNARQFSRMVRYGMTATEALRAATVNAAAALDRAADLGALAPGRLADVIAVRGDPLADIAVLEDVAFVMKGGVVYKAPAGVAPAPR